MPPFFKFSKMFHEGLLLKIKRFWSEIRRHKSIGIEKFDYQSDFLNNFFTIILIKIMIWKERKATKFVRRWTFSSN